MQTIYLDISNKGVVPTIYAKRGDVGRKFKVILNDLGVPYSFPSGSMFSVFYSGTSGEGNYTDIGDKSAFFVDGNSVVVEMIAQMLTNAGEGLLCLVLSEADGNQIGVWNIPYISEPIPGAESEGAKQYYTAFSKAVEDLMKASKDFGVITYIQNWEDLDNLVEPGKYACETAEIAKTLLGCPVDVPFTLDVRYANGKAPHVGQELKPAGKGARLYRQFVSFPGILSEEAKKLYDRVKGLKPQGNGYNGASDYSWYQKNLGTKMVTFTNASHLYGLADIVNGTNGATQDSLAGWTIKLDADIIVNNGDASNWDAETTGLRSWTPIGSGTTKYFAGTFDGQGHYISGLFSVRPRDNGFMCFTVNATVQNLAIINSYFENDAVGSSKPEDAQVLAAFIGRGYGVTLKNLYSDATLVCSANDYHTGGIVGFAKSDDSKVTCGPATIDNAVFNGTIKTNTGTASTLVGGILGGTDTSYATVKNSLFVGSINTNDNNVGGIVGRIHEGSMVSGCISTGGIEKAAGKTVGAIVGELNGEGSFAILDCYYSHNLGLYGKKSNSTATVTTTGSKELSAECMEFSMVPTKWAKVYDSENKPTIEEIGAAPDGYGLGALGSTYAADLNACIRNGWFYTDNYSTNVPYRNYFCFATVFVTARTSKIIAQRLIAPETVSRHVEMLRYTQDGGATWVDEWVNPPMAVGVEYRTTERYGGNSVYTKLINCGQNTHGKEVSLGYPNVIRYAARATNGVVYPFGESTSDYHRRVQISQQEIMIIAGKAAENADTVYCQIWYTK